MYNELLVAIAFALGGGGANLLYESKLMLGKITKSKIANRLGMAALAGALVFYGLADAASTNLDLVGIAQDFGFDKLADFFAMGIPFVASGYFADDVMDAFWAKIKKKFGFE